MTGFDAILALTVTASTGFGAMLGYGWLYPLCASLKSDCADYEGALMDWQRLFGIERHALIAVQIELDIMQRERAADKAKRCAAAKIARAAQTAQRAVALVDDRAKIRAIAERLATLPPNHLRPRDEVVAGVRERRAARRAGMLL